MSAAARSRLLRLHRAALEAVDGRRRTAEALASAALPQHVAVVSIGKAAAHMLGGAFDALDGRIRRALLVTRRGYLRRTWPEAAAVNGIESGHPLPDASSLVAGRQLLDFLDAPGEEGALVVLISGGASSLVEVLPEGMDAATLARVGEWLLASGAPIGAINRVRKRISCIKAGRLAARLKGRETLQLLISDVPGDDPAVIGSGLLVAHGAGDLALEGPEPPDWLRPMLADPPPLAPPAAFERVQTRVIARAADALAGAARLARGWGEEVCIHPRFIDEDAATAGAALGRWLRDEAPPGVHLWSSETTVRLPARPGRGGRCQSLALAAARELEGRPDLWLLAAGSDGSDGPGEDAGALVDGATLARGARAHLDARRCLEAADAGSFLDASGDLLRTGATGTNVMDVLIGLKGAPPG